MEILSAPTVDAMKIQDEENIMQKAIRRVSVVGARVGKDVQKFGRRLSNAIHAMPVGGNPGNKQPFARTSRLIPNTTNDAHIMALVCSKEILHAAQKENDLLRCRRETEAYQSIVRRQQSIRQQRKEMSNKFLSIVQLSVDIPLENLFTELSVDIAEQRKLLPREVRDEYDDLWG
jgi:hypothetical protein